MAGGSWSGCCRRGWQRNGRGWRHWGIVLVLLVVFLLPAMLADFGIRFDPFHQALGTLLPRALGVLCFACPAIRSGLPMNTSASESSQLVLHLKGFDGLSDLLLDLARAQKVDLARISVLALVEQFLAVVESVRLELAAEWLVMAAWLTWLKSRLLVPAETAPTRKRARKWWGGLRIGCGPWRRSALRRPGRTPWPAPGQDVFARGAPEDHTEIDRSKLALDVAGLIRAYLGAARRGATNRRYTPKRLTVWTVKEALSRLSAMLGSLPDGPAWNASSHSTCSIRRSDGRLWRAR